LQSKSGAWLAGTGTGRAGANAVAVTTNRDRNAQKFSFRATAYEASQVRLDVPLFLQLPGYPTGCEAASVAMMLSHAGYDVSIEDVVRAMPYHGSNPDLGFVGNPRTWSGVTIYPPALLGTVRSYAGSAVDLTGASLDTFKAYLRAGKAIACWIRYGSGLHCVAITGFDEQNFYYNDPYVGKDRPISHAGLAAIRAPLGNRALSY
ncbi:MAG: C39 family peptidase, partial [Coriobacteriales bacterium]|nr:C39 family peptidase [Coriobacteriales bacterium]